MSRLQRDLAPASEQIDGRSRQLCLPKPRPAKELFGHRFAGL